MTTLPTQDSLPRRDCAATLRGARLCRIDRFGLIGELELTAAPAPGGAAAGGALLWLRLRAPFRVVRGEQRLLESEDIARRPSAGPRPLRATSTFETLYDLRAHALNSILAAVRPQIAVAEVGPDGGLSLGWGRSFRLHVLPGESQAALPGGGWQLLTR